jgi:hypothetical protein
MLHKVTIPIEINLPISWIEAIFLELNFPKIFTKKRDSIHDIVHAKCILSFHFVGKYGGYLHSAISHHMGLHYVWAFHEMECPPIRLLCMVENIRHMHLVKYGVNFNQFTVCY